MTGLVAALVLAEAIQGAPSGLPPLPAAAEFAAAEVGARRAIMKQVDVLVDEAPGSTFGLIEAGLRDPDALVRLAAAGALRNLRFALTRQQVDPRMARLVVPPASFVETLSAAIDAPDESVRLQSMDALADFDQDKERVKIRLLARHDREDLPLLRAEALMHLRRIAPDDAGVRRVVLAALDNPVAEIRYQGVLGAAAWTPDWALARIGQGLDDKVASIRMACIDALRAYGPRAAAYRDRLKELLDGETSERARRRIEAAVASVASGMLVSPPPPSPPTQNEAPVPTETSPRRQ